MEKVRARMKVQGVKKVSLGAPGSAEITLGAEYDTSIPEDERFARATPSASMTMFIDNPAAVEFFELGASFYLDFVRV